MAIIHPVGKPVDKCEWKVIRYLEENLPDSFHVYHNLELTNNRAHPYEYDLIVFKGPSVWVVEVKDYRGTIKGNAVTWELSNGKFEPSPIPLTNRKARILKDKIIGFIPWLKDTSSDIRLYVDSLIVLCDNQIRISVNDPQKNRVIHLSQLLERLDAQESLSVHLKHDQNVNNAICDMLDRWFGPLTRTPCLGDYEVLDSAFSHDGYSVTYPGRHKLLKTQARVSLKVFRLDPYLPSAVLHRSQTLALQAANALTLVGEHPNIIRCHTPFTCDDDKIVVPFEWVDGPTLRDLLNEGLDWSSSHRLKIFRQVCKGLVHIHRQKIFRRHLSPENIVIVNNDQVKLVGFDFAKITPGYLFSQSSVGTELFNLPDKRYLAPEIVNNPHAASVSSDIFSAGVVLFELMTGYHPFEGQNTMTSTLNKPSTLAPGCPTDVDEIFLHMCKLKPEQRYNSVDEILFDLEVIL